MSENITVQPSPIQRNTKDVAIELLKIHSEIAMIKPNEIEALYTKYYALAETLNRAQFSQLVNFIPQDTKEKINK